MGRSIQEELHLSHMAHRKLVLPRYLSIGLKSGQPSILRYLNEHDGCIQKELANACMVEASTITDSLYSMEKRGLVHRERDPQMRREVRVFITEEGRECIEKLKELFETFDEICLEGFTDEEVEEFRGYLYRLIGNMRRPREI